MFESNKIKKAIFYAKKNYGRIKDGSGTLIYDHCLRVAFYLYRLLNIDIQKSLKEDIVIASLFHDLLEDTKAKEDEIEKRFGSRVLKYTKQMTINFDKGIKKAVESLYNIDNEVFLIKLSDIYDNVSKSFFMVRKNKIEWYEDFFLPLLTEYNKLIDDRVNLIKKKTNDDLIFLIINFSEKVKTKINDLIKFIKVAKNFMY